MHLLLNSVLFVSLALFIKIFKADDGIDLSLFQQHDYQLKFERVELLRYNKNLMKDASIVTFKYNRTTTVANATFSFRDDLGNDFTNIVQAYKFMSNEYRTFPMRFAANGCKAIAANVAGASRLFKCGNFTGCPIVKGKYHICYWHPDQSKLPPLILNGQYKIEVQVVHASTELFVTNAYATISHPLI